MHDIWTNSTHKSGIMVARNIYPEKMSNMSRGRKWSSRALRWAKLESRDLHEALVAAGKSRKEAIVHDSSDKAI